MIPPSNSKAEMGVGTLIIFIAMILVAAVAAAVILQTAGALQQDALATGGAARAEISTAIRLGAAYGTDGRDGNIENITGVVKLNPGGNPLNLEDLTLIFGTPNNTVRFVWSGNQSFNTVNETGTFGVEYLQTGSGHRYGVLQRGELITVSFTPGWPIPESERIEITVIPRIGLPQYFKTTLPGVMASRRVNLQT